MNLDGTTNVTIATYLKLTNINVFDDGKFRSNLLLWLYILRETKIDYYFTNLVIYLQRLLIMMMVCGGLSSNI